MYSCVTRKNWNRSFAHIPEKILPKVITHLPPKKTQELLRRLLQSHSLQICHPCQDIAMVRGRGGKVRWRQFAVRTHLHPGVIPYHHHIHLLLFIFIIMVNIILPREGITSSPPTGAPIILACHHHYHRHHHQSAHHHHHNNHFFPAHMHRWSWPIIIIQIRMTMMATKDDNDDDNAKNIYIPLGVLKHSWQDRFNNAQVISTQSKVEWFGNFIRRDLAPRSK